MGRWGGIRGAIAAFLLSCNQIAGIDDLRTGDPDAASPAGGDSGSAEDGALVAPACLGGQVGLAVTVSDSTPGSGYSGITDNSGALPDISVGTSFGKCVDPGTTQLDLRAVPDDSAGEHDWGSPLCPPGRRCALTVLVPTVLFVDLR